MYFAQRKKELKLLFIVFMALAILFSPLMQSISYADEAAAPEVTTEQQEPGSEQSTEEPSSEPVDEGTPSESNEENSSEQAGEENTSESNEEEPAAENTTEQVLNIANLSLIHI